MTGSILGLSRAAGETAPIILTAAAFFAPMPKSPFSPVMALPYHLYIMATQAVKPAPTVVWGTALRSRRRGHHRRCARGRLAHSSKEQDPMVDTAPHSAPSSSGTFDLRDVSVAYGKETALAGVNMHIPPQAVTALIGPSGCGKSTLLRCLNRMNDELGNVTVGGHGPARRRGHQRARDGPGRPAHARRAGVPAAEPVPDVDLRERRLRAAHAGHPQARRTRRPRRGVADARRAVGRGQEAAQEARVRALRRSAAASVHRARARDAPRGAC